MSAAPAMLSQTETAPRGWSEAEAWAGPEKRREPRYTTCDPVDVFLLDFAGVRISGMLRDVSRDGFRVEIDLPVERGARLKLRLRNQTTIFAVARYCRRAGDTYQVGAEIEWLFCPKSGCAQSATAPAAGGGEVISNGESECYKLASAIVDFHMFPWVEIVNATQAPLASITDRSAHSSRNERLGDLEEA